MAAQPLEAETPDPIVARIQAGDHRDAVRACADRYGAAIGRFCMALLGASGEAEETAQETFIIAYQGMHAFRGDGTVQAWLFGIARRLCARRLETRSRRAGKLRLVSAPPAASPPGEALERSQTAERVRSALNELKPSERNVLVLRYEADLSYRDIAEACAIDEATARKRASRGLARLRKILSKEAIS